MSPQRTCVGCRCTAAPSDLLRLVVDEAARAVVVDERQRLPGRGAYVHPDHECIAVAVRRRAVPRALRAPDVDTSVLSALASAYAKREGSA
ncbi:YlxR family protein [Granulicoccus sp. GXG6511]|uniref:YlxR family protein n=1 Tax=Granulicoccus sp. GXG6511 TaxID=3381351 RepID=UPI003D7C3E3D